MLRENEIGGTHINYYIHCKRQLWYYVKPPTLQTARLSGGGFTSKTINCRTITMELAFAKAQVELKKWLLESEGGY